MKSTPVATIEYSRSAGNPVAFRGGMPLRIGDLLEERDALHEEVQQLRAALQIFTEIVRRLQVNRPQRAA